MAKEYSAYLHDPNAYPPHTKTANERTKINNSALTRDEERLLSEKWNEIEMKNVKNTVYTFKVAEPHKQRCRVVHACHVNEECKQHKGPTPFKLNSADEVNKILQEAAYVTQFDARSMYDQFTLAEAVAAHFVFRDREGRLVALNRLPMGFCYACGIAQSLSLVLTTFSTENEWYDITCIVHLDNYLFAFNKKKDANPTHKDLQTVVIKTLSTFLQRTVEVDLQLNEMDREEITSFMTKNTAQQWSEIEKLSPKIFTFLGVTYDMQLATRTAAEKTWDKLTTLEKVIFPHGRMNPSTTPRHLAMIMGVISWIKRMANNRHMFYNLHRNIAELAYVLWARPELWDTPLPELSFMFQEIPELIQSLRKSPTATIYPSLMPHHETAICISDASKTGWGAFILIPHRAAWKISIVKGEWPRINNLPDPIFESSTFAEPKAVEQVLQKVEFPPFVKHVLFVTDHSPLVAASQSHQARCFTYFKVLEKLEKQSFTYNMLFIKGTENVADAPSRGQERTVERRDLERIAAGAGTGYASALLSPSKEILPHVVGFV